MLTTLLATALLALPDVQDHTPVVPQPPTPARHLMDVVPVGTVSLWHRRATPETALMDSYAFEVVDAVIDARFDEFALETLDKFGADEGLVSFIASWRNTFMSVAAVVPWRELVEREFVWAQTMSPSFCTDMDIPSMLLACRPEPARLADLERSIAGFMGSAAALLGVNGLYEIRSQPSATGRDTTVYRLSVPAFGNSALMQAAVHNNTLMLGVGEEYFADALNLLMGTGETQRLSESPRFQAAFADLPSNSPSHEYLDMPLLLQGAEDVRELLVGHQYDAGTLQPLLNESFHLIDHVDTIASATHCAGADVVKETITRFDPERALHNPMYGAGMAAPASGELLYYVPADAVSFSMRGTVDLGPIWRHMLAEFRNSATWAEDALWGWGILEAAVDLSIERDLLSWIGAEHVTVVLPSRAKYPQPGETDTVVLCKVPDPEAAKKALERAVAIFEAGAPRVIGGIQGFLTDVGLNYKVEAVVGPAEGSFRMLDRLEISLGPIPVPQFTFGVMGDLLVLSTSSEALMSCMLVAAEEEDGLMERPMVDALLGRDNLASAELVPVGAQMQQSIQGLQEMSGMLNGFLGPMSSDNPPMQTGLEVMNDLFARILGVMKTVDFLGDSVIVSESRYGGLVRYERETTRLLGAESRPTPAVATNADPH